MSYIKEYFKALFWMVQSVSFVFLLTGAYFGLVYALPLLVVACVAAIAGPISLIINNKERVRA